MQGRRKRSERNVKRQRDVKNIYIDCVKDLRVEKELLSDAQGYKYKEYIEVQIEIIKSVKKGNKGNDLKYICIYYVRN